MANLWNYLFCIKGEDKTAEIVSWEFDNNKSVVYITYSNGKSYPYSIKNVLFLKNPKNILHKYNIPILRLSTTGSGEREKIYSKISELIKK